MHDSFRDIATFMDPVKTPTNLRQLCNLHSNCENEERSFRNIWNRHNTHRIREERFMFLNTFLMDADWPAPSDARKPAVKERTKDIGEFIKNNADIATLAEIFEKHIYHKLLNAGWGSNHPFKTDSIGENTPGESGLGTISQNMNFLRVDFHEYRFETGDDSWAGKGVLLTEFDLGPNLSNIEIYNTHFQADAEFEKQMQVIELAEFFEREHKPENYAMIVGDFNIDFHDRIDPIDSSHPNGNPANNENRHTYIGVVTGGGGISADRKYYSPKFFEHFFSQISNYPDAGFTSSEFLFEIFSKIGFEDLWMKRNGTLGYTSDLERRLLYEGNKISYTDIICTPFANGSIFCKDEDVEATIEMYQTSGNKVDTTRIDYIFVLKPSELCNVHVDFSRPRRLRMPRVRKNEAIYEVPFMSDHLGLFTNLLFSRKEKQEVRRQFQINAKVTVQDYDPEFWNPNSKNTSEAENTINVSTLNSVIALQNATAEDEVRLELTITAQCLSNEDISIHIKCLFFEGVSETTTDLEMQHIETIILAKDASINHNISLWNYDEKEKRDYAQVYLTLKNKPI